MAMLGAVGRYGTLGWRRDLLVLAFPTQDAIVLGSVAFSAGSGTKAALAPSALALEDRAYVASGGGRVDAAPGDALAITDQPLGAEGGGSAVIAPETLELGALATEVLSGASVAYTAQDLVVEGVAYAALAGVALDFAVPADLALVDTPYQDEVGASSDYVPADPLVLLEAATDVPAGNRVDFQVAPLALESLAYQDEAGVALDFPAVGLAIAEAAFAPGSGTVTTFVPAAPIVLPAATLDARAGATVDFKQARRTFRSSAVMAAAVMAGPTISVQRSFRLSPVSFAPQAGATVEMIPDDLVMQTVAFEAGARRKPVRGLFLIYKT